MVGWGPEKCATTVLGSGNREVLLFWLLLPREGALRAGCKPTGGAPGMGRRWFLPKTKFKSAPLPHRFPMESPPARFVL